jgi:pimeloyl-ACP methyl ester carboxylesterase
MHLAAVVHGSETERPPLLIAHGLFGSARNWGAIAKRLALHRRVIAVDMRNHGDSPRSREHGYVALAEDLAATIAEYGGRADVLGHSMGGKAAMVLALSRPATVRRLIVADMAPVAYGHSQLRYVRAMQAVDLAAVTRRSEADAALAGAVPEPGLRAFLLQSLAVDPGEAASWKINLAALADQMPQIMGFPAVRGSFDGPTLFLTGAVSDYVLPAHWAHIRALFPAAEHREIPGAGHWLHAEAPAAFIAAASGFLEAAG